MNLLLSPLQLFKDPLHWHFGYKIEHCLQF